MASSGYDSDRFVGNGYEPFLCIICLNVVEDPCQCHGCGKLFCKPCIESWSIKNADVKCPNRCAVNTITPIFSRALQRLYLSLDIKCKNPKCQKVIKLIDLKSHEASCLMLKCWNYDICDRPRNESIKNLKPCCSELCSTVLFLQEKFGNKKAMYDLLTAYSKNDSRPVSNPSFPPLIPAPYVQDNGTVTMAWDVNRTGGGIALTENNTNCFLKEQSYLFRTTIADKGFTSGVHYWEIVADNRTENELKIGVATSNSFDYNSAFCDHPFGFAFYGLGQLRHGSNAAGPAFGKKFKKDGVLGVLLNMNTGVLGFSLNGEYMGVAFKDPKLTVGPIYPAVALLHCAGCRLRSGLPVPSYFRD